MVKGIVLALILVALGALLLLSNEFTGKSVTGPCSGTNNYYLCIDGEGDFVLSGTAVPINDINETIENYGCKLVSLSDDESFVFRYTNSAIKGIVYNSNKGLVGENVNQHIIANYKCAVAGDCTLSCSEYRVWE